MKDIVERLRAWAQPIPRTHSGKLTAEAAREIERLRRTVQNLEAELQRVHAETRQADR